MNNHFHNIQHCIRIYIQCLDTIKNSNLDDNLNNIINTYILTLDNVSNIDNISYRLDISFFTMIHNITMMYYDNNVNNYIHTYNQFHNQLILFHNEITNL